MKNYPYLVHSVELAYSEEEQKCIPVKCGTYCNQWDLLEETLRELVSNPKVKEVYYAGFKYK